MTFVVKKEALRHWDIEQGRFVVPEGLYQFMIGSSSADIRLKQAFRITP